MPIRLMPIAWAVLAAAALVGLYWLADAVGDLREEKVRAQIRTAGEKVNVKLDEHANAQDAIDAIVTARVAAAVADAQRVPSEFKYTAEQAAALNAIRRAGQ